mmetsp:Transcript_22978/g.67701  ORF Transcript_22978/g.67701 Transcript_22978/m.67701 type:complete len:278 (-) Transcript_22978:1353-2186(-)
METACWPSASTCCDSAMLARLSVSLEAASAAFMTLSRLAGSSSSAATSSHFMGVENILKVPLVAASCSAAEKHAVPSVRVTVLYPFSKAVRMVDSTQQLVSRPPITTVSMPCSRSRASRSVPGKESRPRLPLTTTSPGEGVIIGWKSAAQVKARKSCPSWHPLRMPSLALGLSLPSAFSNVIGRWKTFAPHVRAVRQRRWHLASMSWLSITSLTERWSLPPSLVNSFWNSIIRRAVLLGTTSEPPFASAAEKTRRFSCSSPPAALATERPFAVASRK